MGPGQPLRSFRDDTWRKVCKGWLGDVSEGNPQGPKIGRAKTLTYPFQPKTTAKLRPGDFWPIPLMDGSFGCGRVLEVSPRDVPGARVQFYGALMDWRGSDLPTAERLAGSTPLEQAIMHLRSITQIGGQVIGNRPLNLERIEPCLVIHGSTVRRAYEVVRPWSRSDNDALPRLSWWGWNLIWLKAHQHFLGMTLPSDAAPSDS